jgi:hypothetical protein
VYKNKFAIFTVARRAYGQSIRIPAAFATYDPCSQERDGSMSYNVQAAFLPEGFLRKPGHLPNIPKGWNNMMKKAAKV